jgi:hypothetical protein
MTTTQQTTVDVLVRLRFGSAEWAGATTLLRELYQEQAVALIEAAREREQIVYATA